MNYSSFNDRPMAIRPITMATKLRITGIHHFMFQRILPAWVLFLCGLLIRGYEYVFKITKRCFRDAK